MSKQIKIQYDNDTYIVMSAYNYDIMCKDKEIEKLNNIIKLRTEEHNNINSFMKEYKSRIDKAIEYIEQLTNDEESIELMDINSLVQEELLSILKGVDKDYH